MADNYDKILEKFFNGGLDLAIKMRETDLRHPQTKFDGNIGGGSAKNKPSNYVETTMMKFESDEKLNKLKQIRATIQTCVDLFPEEKKAVFYQRYRNRMSWIYIGQVNHIDESTARRWRDDLKKKCRLHNILETDI